MKYFSQFMQNVSFMITLQSFLTQANKAQMALSQATTEKDLRSAALLFSEASVKTDKLLSKVQARFEEAERRRNKETEDMNARIAPLEAFVLKQLKELEPPPGEPVQPDPDPAQTLELRSGYKSSLLNLSEIRKSSKKHDSELAQYDSAILSILEASQQAFRATCAYCAQAHPETIQFGAKSAQLASNAWKVVSRFPDRALNKVAAPFCSLGLISGAVAEKTRTASATESERSNLEWIEERYQSALDYARDAERALRFVDTAPEHINVNFVCAHSECAQILFLGNERERAGHWIQECFKRDKKASLREFGLESDVFVSQLPAGFREFAAQFAPLSNKLAA